MASIRKRGNTYQITVSNGRDVMGNQIREMTTFTPDQSLTTNQQKKSLEAFVFEFEQKVKAGKVLKGEKITFMDYTELWLKDYAQNQLEATSLSNYKQHLNVRILPAIGHLKIADINPLHLQSLYNNLTEDGVRSDGKKGGYSYQTIKKTHAIISNMLKTAVYWQMIESNPCDRVQVPNLDKSKEKKVKYFTQEQAEIFLSFLDKPHTTTYKAHARIDDTGKSYTVNDYKESRTIPEQLKLFFYLSIFGGFRRGELVAITWNDIDFENNAISINKSSAYVDKKTITKSPKSISSNRLISLPDFIIAMARHWKIEQAKYKLELGDQWVVTEGNDLKYVYTQWNGKQMAPSTPYQTFKKIIGWYNETVENEDEKLPDIPLHGLRHTSASLLISKNLDIQTISGRLGHSSSNVTFGIYAHSFKKMDKVAADILGDMLPAKKKSI
ncbi:MAG: tyrosine-type recombinase/integrase [Lachnotalea sp.]